MACSTGLFRLSFCSYVALAPFVVWQFPWFTSTLCDDADAMIGSMIWCCRFCVYLRVVVSFVVLVFVFVFAGSRSQMDKLVSWLPKPILMLFEGGAAWGWRCSGVALLEGGAAWGWRCSGVALLRVGAAWGWRFLGVALLEEGAAWGWRCSGVALIVYVDRRSTEYCWSLLNIDATQWWLIGY
jgi:hypothetical protein